MVLPNLGLRLRDKLGADASLDLTHAFEEARNDMVMITTDRFEARLTAVGAELRQEMARMDSGLRIMLAEGLVKIRTDLSESRVEVVRWSFYFWIGQFTATAALVGILLRFAAR